MEHGKAHRNTHCVYGVWIFTATCLIIGVCLSVTWKHTVWGILSSSTLMISPGERRAAVSVHVCVWVKCQQIASLKPSWRLFSGDTDSMVHHWLGLLDSLLKSQVLFSWASQIPNQVTAGPSRNTRISPVSGLSISTCLIMIPLAN